jgi:hypothetical protein
METTLLLSLPSARGTFCRRSQFCTLIRILFAKTLKVEQNRIDKI